MMTLPSALHRACTGLPEASFPAGSELIAEGAPGGRLLVLVDGAVTVLRGKVEVASVDEPGAIFGEMSLLLGVPNTATVTTARDSQFIVIEDGAAFMRENPDVTLHVCRMLALRVNLLSGYLADLKTQFAGDEGHLGMVHEILCGLCQHPHSDVTLGSDRLPDPRS